MPWCPECKREYRPAFHICSDCKVELVDVLNPHINHEENTKTPERWVFLTEVTKDYEADVIEALFRSQGILLLKKYQGAGEVLKIYVGMTNQGVDIFVPESQFSQAKQLLDNTSDQVSPPIDLTEKGKYNKRRIIGFKMVVVCIIVLIIVEFIVIWQR